ncbi:hypothetical protein ACFV00_28735, partial [Streptomyces californicus]
MSRITCPGVVPSAAASSRACRRVRPPPPAAGAPPGAVVVVPCSGHQVGGPLFGIAGYAVGAERVDFVEDGMRLGV